MNVWHFCLIEDESVIPCSVLKSTLVTAWSPADIGLDRVGLVHPAALILDLR